MSDEFANIMNLAWNIVSGVAVAAWVAAPIVWKKVKRRWIWLPWAKLKPSRRGARDLTQLVKFLGQVQEWLSSTRSEIAAKIRHDLSRIEWNVWSEALSYIALHSSDDEKRCLALRNLSQIEDAKSLDQVVHVVRGVLHDPLTPPGVKKVANAALQELEHRRNLNAQKKSSEAHQDSGGRTTG